MFIEKAEKKTYWKSVKFADIYCWLDWTLVLGLWLVVSTFQYLVSDDLSLYLCFWSLALLDSWILVPGHCIFILVWSQVVAPLFPSLWSSVIGFSTQYTVSILCLLVPSSNPWFSCLVSGHCLQLIIIKHLRLLKNVFWEENIQRLWRRR